jgi:adenosine/AMP kinase
MPRVVGIDHLVLSVDDLARSMYKSRPKQKRRKAWAHLTHAA